MHSIYRRDLGIDHFQIILIIFDDRNMIFITWLVNYVVRLIDLKETVKLLQLFHLKINIRLDSSMYDASNYEILSYKKSDTVYEI